MDYRGDDDKCDGCGCDPCIGASCPSRQIRFGPMRRYVVPFGLSIGAIIVLTGSSCMIAKDPCFNVPQPSAELLAVAARHPNIEIDYVLTDKIECGLVNGRWERERD